MKRTIAFLLFVILLASCSPRAITSTIAPAETAVTTATIEPTITPTSNSYHTSRWIEHP